MKTIRALLLPEVLCMVVPSMLTQSVSKKVRDFVPYIIYIDGLCLLVKPRERGRFVWPQATGGIG
ncbi:MULTISPECIES: transposase [Paraburkholderia]|uniref:transposase n=1 Tax=Paraburkholderia TaxID=1822464 RepID=UPI0013A70448|nr:MULTISPECIES: transposase [Paraburkholderia]MDH6153391.1 hypothetical protein [Paraburkholderia sp. WSM4179]